MMILYRPGFGFGGAMSSHSLIARPCIANCPSIECANRMMGPVIRHCCLQYIFRLWSVHSVTVTVTVAITVRRPSEIMDWLDVDTTPKSSCYVNK